jgi:hypothetical protein
VDLRIARTEHFVFSNEIGVRKPDPAAFAALTEAIGVPAEATSFIDDNQDNIAAANDLGYDGILLDTFEGFMARWRERFPDLAAGLVGLELGAHSHAHVHGFQFTMTAPGWGPRVAYAGSLVTATFVPFRVIGYLALSYLVYATLLDAVGRALSGVLGFASCLSCSLPVAGSLAAGVVGTAGGVGVAAYSIDISTAVYVAAVGLLILRPRFEP